MDYTSTLEVNVTSATVYSWLRVESSLTGSEGKVEFDGALKVVRNQGYSPTTLDGPFVFLKSLPNSLLSDFAWKQLGNPWLNLNTGNTYKFTAEKDAPAGEYRLKVVSFTRLSGGSSISGFSWLNALRDGVRSGTDSPSAYAVVQLLQDGVTIGETDPDADGYYSFGSLAAGTYSVRFAKPAGYWFTRKDAGGIAYDSIDSDADPYSGVTDPIIVGNNHVVSNVSAGFVTNSPPQAAQDALTIDEDSPGTAYVLLNDLDSDGPNSGPLTLADAFGASYGTLSISGSGVTYTPNANWHGTDTFYYTVSDPFGGIAYGLVTVTVLPINDAPVAVDDTASTHYAQGVSAPVLLNDIDVDGDALTVIGYGSPAHGSVTYNAQNSAFTYTPHWSYVGPDSFTYTVRDPAGLTSTATAHLTVTAPPLGSVSGRVWIDADTDGIQDEGEAGWNGLTVRIWNHNYTQLIGYHTTSNDGLYHLGALAGGDYNLQFDQPPGTVYTAGGPTRLVPVWWGTHVDADAGLAMPGFISGRLWIDTDVDGVQDAGEAGWNGLTARLYNWQNQHVADATTANDGHYAFVQPLPYGLYRLVFDRPAYMAYTNGGHDRIVYAPAGGTATVDGGLAGEVGIGGRAWNDTNSNALLDGESGPEGVKVTLYTANGNEVQKVPTIAGGYYSFVGIPSGTYRIVFDSQPGKVFTTQDAYANGYDTIDSDVDFSGRTAQFSVTAGTSASTAIRDAGYVSLGGGGSGATIGSQFWFDANGDGLRNLQPGYVESGISGSTVVLSTAAGTYLRSVTTGPSGTYSFDNVADGQYRVRFSESVQEDFLGFLG